jgi:hypothetical protein
MPDNFIQQPENTQNYNRYAYVLNNPLMYTDPSGELIGAAILIGALIAATTYTMTALLADVPFSVGGLLKATFIGAASAAVTFGIGSAASSMFSVPAVGFWQGAYQGAIIGAISGAGGTVANAIFSGQQLTLKAVLGGAITGAIIGGAIGGIQAGIRAQDGEAGFWRGSKTLDTSQGVGMHGDPIAMKKAGFGRNSFKTKFVGKFKDANVYESTDPSIGKGATSGGITLPPGKIIVGKGAYRLYGKLAKVTDLFHHEYGHILQAKNVGLEAFYKVIAPQSLITSNMDIADSFWTETWANHLAEKEFGCFYNSVRFPSAPLSKFNKAILDAVKYTPL